MKIEGKRFGDLRVEDVMTSELVTVPEDTTLIDAAALFAERHISGAPVVNAQGKAVGHLSRSDLYDPNRDVGGGTVASIMTRMLCVAHPHDPLKTAIGLMVSENIHRVIVVDIEGNLVGLVSPMDVLRALAATT